MFETAAVESNYNNIKCVVFIWCSDPSTRETNQHLFADIAAATKTLSASSSNVQAWVGEVSRSSWTLTTQPTSVSFQCSSMFYTDQIRGVQIPGWCDCEEQCSAWSYRGSARAGRSDQRVSRPLRRKGSCGAQVPGRGDLAQQWIELQQRGFSECRDRFIVDRFIFVRLKLRLYVVFIQRQLQPDV